MKVHQVDVIRSQTQLQMDMETAMEIAILLKPELHHGSHGMVTMAKPHRQLLLDLAANPGPLYATSDQLNVASTYGVRHDDESFVQPTCSTK